MGHLKADQPMIPKVLIGPAIMIMSSTNPALMHSFAQNASRATPKPTVQADEGPGVAMFEACEPSPEGDIYCDNDRGQTMAVAAPGLVAQRILYLLQALLARPAGAGLKMISQEVEPNPGRQRILAQPSTFSNPVFVSFVLCVVDSQRHITPATAHTGTVISRETRPAKPFE
jgi:hypothetical protein